MRILFARRLDVNHALIDRGSSICFFRRNAFRLVHRHLDRHSDCAIVAGHHHIITKKRKRKHETPYIIHHPVRHDTDARVLWPTLSLQIARDVGHPFLHLCSRETVEDLDSLRSEAEDREKFARARSAY